MTANDPVRQEALAKKVAERIVGTLIQTYLSPAIVDVLRNSIMADHDPKIKITLNTNHLQHVEYELDITAYEGSHAEAFPLFVTIHVLTPQSNDALWRKLHAAINENPTLNRRYIITDLTLNVDSGSVSFYM